MGMPLASHHSDAAHITQTAGSVPASFKGHAQLVGSTLTITNLTGTIGKDHFTGYGTGTEAGKQFEGGNVYLSNSNGTVQFSLASAVTVKVRRSTRQQVSLVAVNGTGEYASYVGLHRDVDIMECACQTQRIGEIRRKLERLDTLTGDPEP